MTWLLILPAYALGTFPSAVMVARRKGVDITRVGSGNPGASNIARTLGARWGVAVFVLDALKGTIPALVGVLLDQRPVALAAVAAAVLGHMYPATRSLKGGKGVATMAGATLVLQPLAFLILLGLWFVTRKLSGIASVGSLVIAIGLPVTTALIGAPWWEVWALAMIAALVMVRHSANIKRLLGGTELSASRPR